MRTLTRFFQQLAASENAELHWLVLGVIAIIALLGIVVQQPLIVVGAVLALPVAVSVRLWPDLATPVVVFVLYSNAAVVAVRFHGVPHIAGLLAPMPLLVPLVYHLIIRRKNLVVTHALPWILLYLVVQLIGVLYAIRPDVAKNVFKTFVFEGLAVYLIIVNVVRTPRVLKHVVWALLAAGAFMGGLSTYQQVTGTFHNDFGGFAQTTERGFGVEEEGKQYRQKRLCGPIGDQNRYGQIMFMLVPLGLYQIGATKFGVEKALAVAATGFTAMGCALTFSRGVAVSFVILLMVMCVMRQVSAKQIAVLGLCVLLVLAAAPQFLVRLASIPMAIAIVDPTFAGGEEADGAIKGRATVMLAAARVCAENPVFGVGPGNFNFYSQEYGREGGFRGLEGNREAHCLYLEIAAENGLVGLTFFLAAVVITLRDLSRARRRWLHSRPDDANLASAFILVIVAFLSTSIFLHLSYARFFWLMFALATVASCTEEEPADSQETGHEDNVQARANNNDLLTSRGVAV